MKKMYFSPEKDGFFGVYYEHGTHFAFPQSMLDIVMPLIGSLFTVLLQKPPGVMVILILGNIIFSFQF